MAGVAGGAPRQHVRVPAGEEEQRHQLQQPRQRPQPAGLGGAAHREREQGLGHHDGGEADDAQEAEERVAGRFVRAPPRLDGHAAGPVPHAAADHRGRAGRDQQHDHDHGHRPRADRLGLRRAPALVPGVDDQAHGVERRDDLAEGRRAAGVEPALGVHVHREPVVEALAQHRAQRLPLARGVPQHVVAEVVGLAADAVVPAGVAPRRGAAAAGVHRAQRAVRGSQVDRCRPLTSTKSGGRSRNGSRPDAGSSWSSTACWILATSPVGGWVTGGLGREAITANVAAARIMTTSHGTRGTPALTLPMQAGYSVPPIGGVDARRVRWRAAPGCGRSPSPRRPPRPRPAAAR